MATWWVSTTGSQTNSGTNYANAWQNVEEIAYKVRGVGSQGDTVNVVNDGTYVLTAQGAEYINSWAGTNFTDDWGLRIRGTDSSGNPEMAHCKIPNTNGTYAMYRAQVGSVYFIMEGLHFYCATGCDVNANLSIILIDGANVGTSPAWLFRSCSFDWGLEAVPRGRRNVVELNTSDSGKYYFDHCYYGGGEAIMEDGGVAVCTPDGVDLTRCIFVQNESNIEMQVIEGVIQAGNVFSATHNTFVNLYTNTVTRIQGPIQAMVLNSEGANASTGTVKDNLYYTGVRGDGSNIATKWEFTNLFAQITPHSNVFNTSDIGYNGWVGQTNVVSDATPNPYRPPFSASNTSPIKATDLLTFATSSADVFNDVTAAYSWTAGSYTIDLPRDLRPMLGSLLTAASDGGYVGALEGANSAPVAGPVSYNVTVGDTLVTTATDGVLSNTTDPDLDTLTASVVAAPSHASALGSTRRLVDSATRRTRPTVARTHSHSRRPMVRPGPTSVRRRSTLLTRRRPVRIRPTRSRKA